MNPFTALKNFSQLHFTKFFYFILFFHLSCQHYTTLLCYSYLQLTSFHLTSLHFLLFIAFTFPSLVFTFLTLVLKICFLSWEVPVAPSCSLFQPVMVLFTKEYFLMFQSYKNMSDFCVRNQLLQNWLILGGGSFFKFHRTYLKIRAITD